MFRNSISNTIVNLQKMFCPYTEATEFWFVRGLRGKTPRP